MKRTLIAIIVTTLCAAGFAVQAGPRGGDEANAEKRIERRIDKMSERLGLDANQRAAVESLMREQMEKRRAFREESKARMDEILTEEQRAQLDQIRTERRGKRKARMAERRAQRQAKEPKS
ncbi:MAG: periplasmic heavy metal sensor [Chromatiales bacterium]|jgi:periplasmic protein CpxP/Spy|nr:periplasmic heavy metal sensor [Chromatiales bacterium]